jgi:hypothetical protein
VAKKNIFQNLYVPNPVGTGKVENSERDIENEANFKIIMISKVLKAKFNIKLHYHDKYV